MKWLQHISIKHTIAILAVATSAIVILIGAVSLFVESTTYSKKKSLTDFQLQTDLLSEYLVLPVVFQDSSAIVEIVEKTQIIRNIHGVYICDNQGNTLYTFGEAAEIQPWSFAAEADPVHKGAVYIRSALAHEGTNYGGVVVAYSLERLYARTLWIAFLYSMALLLLVALSLLIAYRVQRVITKPIDGLLDEMQQVIKTGNYDAQIQSDHTNEFGLLYRTFNKLMQHINSSNRELLQLNERIAAQHRQLLALLSALPGNVYVVHSETMEVLFANDAVMSSLDSEVLAPTPCYKLLHGLEQPCADCTMRDLQALQEPIVHERFEEATGRYLSVTSKLIEWSSGVIVRLEMSIDITALRKAEKARRLSEERLELVIKGSKDAPWDWDIDKDELYFSPQYYRQFGYAPGGLPTDSLAWAQLIHPEDRKNTDNILASCLEGSGNGFAAEFRLQHKLGHYIPVLARGYISRNAEGKAIRLTGTNMDLTEQKQAADRLKQSQLKLLAVLDSTPFPVILFDRRSEKIEYWSQAAHRLFGYTAASYEEWLPLAFPEPGCRQKADQDWQMAVERARESGESLNAGEHRLACQDGSERVCAMHLTFIKENLVVTVNDITLRKRVEEEKKKISEQLQQSQKMESIGRLAGGVAHDFNNMLQAIIGNAEFAEEEAGVTAEIKGFLSEIKTAAERSAALTSQLLAFARKQTVAPRVIDLNESISGVIKMIKRLIGEDIEVKWYPKEGAWNIRLDPVQLDQIITNLAVNSRDAFSGSGKITIEVENTTIDDSFSSYPYKVVPGDYVVISFSDNGCGIEKDKLITIFEPFYTTKPLGEGTGLGLATVYGIVKQNSGFINVYSEKGVGTTFRIYFPRHSAEQQFSPPRVEKPAPGKNEVILMVEDEATVLRFGRMALKRLGYVVHAAESPDQALQLARELEGSIDLLISDVVMPGMDGRELADKIQHMQPGLKHLFISGYTANVIATKGILQEGVNFLQKPFNSSALAAKVRSVLDME